MFHCYVSDARVLFDSIAIYPCIFQKKDSTLVSQNAKRALHLPNSVVFFRKMLDAYDRMDRKNLLRGIKQCSTKILLPSFILKPMFFFVSPSHPQNPSPSKKIHTCFCCRGVSVNNSTLTCYLQFFVLRKISKKPDSRICVSTSLGPLDILDGEQLNPC